MADSIPVSTQFAGGNTTSVEFPEEQATVTLDLSQLGPRLFRVASVPFMVEAVSIGDTIEAESRAEGGLRFVRIIEAGGWRTHEFILSANLIESKHIAAIRDRVVSLGGHWERVFGGVILLYLPPTTDYDPTGDILRQA